MGSEDPRAMERLGLIDRMGDAKNEELKAGVGRKATKPHDITVSTGGPIEL